MSNNHSRFVLSSPFEPAGVNLEAEAEALNTRIVQPCLRPHRALKRLTSNDRDFSTPTTTRCRRTSDLFRESIPCPGIAFELSTIECVAYVLIRWRSS
jgi:hypothetical protein